MFSAFLATLAKRSSLSRCIHVSVPNDLIGPCPPRCVGSGVSFTLSIVSIVSLITNACTGHHLDALYVGAASL